MARPQVSRILSVAGLIVGAVVLAVILLGGGGGYTIHARFVDAGQLVPGGLVEVGSQKIGTIKKVSLSNDNRADIELNITDDYFNPLHEGTTATIATVGLTGVANRIVRLEPGPTTGRKLPDGAILDPNHTHGIVDLDILLDEIDPKTRDQLQRVIRNGPKLFGGDPQSTNRAFYYLNPALSEARRLSAEIDTDQNAVEQLVVSASQVVSALASRRSDLEGSVTHTAATLRAIASERTALEDALARAPAVLRQSVGTLRNVRASIAIVRPVLREVKPIAAPLARFIRELPPAGRAVTPVLGQLRGQLPALRRVLAGLPAVARVGVPALSSTTTALNGLLPILEQLRPYTIDIGAGLGNGLGGGAAGSYDANGHFVRVNPIISNNGALGLLTLLGAPLTDVSQLTGVRTGLVARCPGAAAPLATDRSNPWAVLPELTSPAKLTCDAAQSR